MSVYLTRAGDMVDAIAWARLGDAAHAEALFALNPVLEAYGPVLPAGVRLTLPDAAPEAERAPVIRLWGPA
jgi:phage tail protein X